MIRGVVFLGLLAFLPLVYYLAVVGGLLPYGAILLIAIRNINDPSLLMFSVIHLAIYGVVLYWLSGVFTRLIVRVAGAHTAPATVIVVLVLTGIGLLPIFGIAHGQIQWRSAYALYASDTLR